METAKNPLDLEELIRQAGEQMKKWKKPSNEPQLSNRTMQELLDGRPAPS